VAGVDVALLVLRLVLGGVYVAHGARKLGWIGGGRLGDFTASIARRGFRPAPAWAAAAVFSEVVGGTLTVLGFLGPVGGALLLAQSVTIAVLVANRGFWHTDEGLEYPFVLGAAALVVALVGPGALSVDAVFDIRLHAGVPELVVAAAVAGSLASLLTRRPGDRPATKATPGGIGPPGRRSG
jgi:putative oxidoreductase